MFSQTMIFTTFAVAELFSLSRGMI